MIFVDSQISRHRFHLALTAKVDQIIQIKSLLRTNKIIMVEINLIIVYCLVIHFIRVIVLCTIFPYYSEWQSMYDVFFFTFGLNCLIIALMFRKYLLSLSSVVHDQHKIFRSHDQSNCKTLNYSNIRQQISEFLLFLRDSVKRYPIFL